jgi:predicted Zn-dependent peptidase
MPELRQSAFFVRNEARVLPGIFVMGASVRATDASRALQTAQKVLQDLMKSPPTVAEFERVRGETVATFNRQMEKPETIADLWLDAETYKLPSVIDRARALSAVSPADLQRVAGRLLSNGINGSTPRPANDATFATVVVGSASQLKSDLERSGKVEVMGEGETAAPPPKVPGTGSATKKNP